MLTEVWPGYSIDYGVSEIQNLGVADAIGGPEFFNYVFWVPGAAAGGGNSSGASGGPNPAIGQSILKGIVYQLRYAGESIGRNYFCGKNPANNVLHYAEQGATKGAIVGAFAGSEAGPPGMVAAGAAGAGSGGIGGAALGGAASIVCSLAGAYGPSPWVGSAF
jgi:hypothetical protein